MSIITEILEHPLLREKPPVLCDIGASGHIHSSWKQIAPYAHCIAFDADDREMAFTEKQSGYKKLLVYNCIATAGTEETMSFYLTKSPFCSSSLPPDESELADWEFADKFTVEKTVTVKSKNIAAVIQELGYDYVDWFKCDSQGTDLRLFNALPESVRTRCLAVEIEPGIIDSYKGEDKLSSVLESLPSQGFWLSAAVVKGSRRIKPATMDSLGFRGMFRKLASFSHKASPGWIEMFYLNSMKSKELTQREYLLLCAIALLHGQYGCAWEAAAQGNTLFPDPLFGKIQNAAHSSIQASIYKLGFLPAVAEKIKKVLRLD